MINTWRVNWSTTITPSRRSSERYQPQAGSWTMVKIKICGITNLEDALLAVEYGADALGFIFYPPSRRYVEPEKVKEIVAKLPPFIFRVGVFVYEQPEKIGQIVNGCRLDGTQLHGSETPEFCRMFRRR